MILPYNKTAIITSEVPGFIYMEDVMNSIRGDKDPNALVDFNQRMQLMNRPGRPEEVAQLIAFLSSDL